MVFFVFSIAARLIKLPPVTAPGESVSFDFNSIGKWSDEFYFYFYFVLRH